MEANSEQTMDDAAAVTLELLETRLRAIEYALYGHQTPGGLESGKEKTAATRLKELEQGLNHYTQKTQVIQELLKLR